MITQKCAICDIELTHENKHEPRVQDYQGSICKDHEGFAHVYLADVSKLKLGLIKELPERFNKCQICDCELNQAEKLTVSEYDYLITCMEHRDVKDLFQLDRAKKWFEYKTLFPDVSRFDHDDWEAFSKWYHNTQKNA